MKLHIYFKCCYLTILLMVISSYSFCQTKIPLPFLNYANGFTNTGNNLLEIGLTRNLYSTNNLIQQIKPDSLIGFLRFGVRVPVLKDDKNMAQIDRNTNNFSLFGSPEIIIFRNKHITKYKIDTITRYTSIEPTIEWGSKKYTYYPNRSEESKKEDWENNWATEVRLRHFRAKGKRGAWQWGFYGRFRVSQDVKDSDPLNILNPSTNVVNDIIVSSPNITKSLSPALGLQVYPGIPTPITFAPIFYYYAESKDNKAGFEKSRIRTEQWVYFYPITQTLGLRVGFGAFQNIYLKGKGNNENLFGGLVGVKVDTNILKSIF